MASFMRALLADSLPEPKHSLSDIMETLESSAGIGGERVKLGMVPRRSPK